MPKITYEEFLRTMLDKIHLQDDLEFVLPPGTYDAWVDNGDISEEVVQDLSDE